MALCYDKKIMKKWLKIAEEDLTCSFQWDSSHTEYFLTSDHSETFNFCGFDCSFCSDCRNGLGGYYSVICLSNTTFPNFFSCSYILSLTDNKGNEYLSTKGIVRKKTGITLYILMTINLAYISNLSIPLNSLSLRISWVEERSIGVFDRSVQTEELKSPPLKDKCTSTEKDDTSLLKLLSEDLECFYEKKMETDCLLKVGSTEFPVHRQVLSARSDVFQAMFHHDTLESRSGTVEISDIEAETLNNVLFYVYTGRIRCLAADSAVSMYIVADKYALMELKDKCIDFLLYSLTLENFCDAAVLAHTHGITELENKVILFIEERLKEIPDNENWKHFLKNKSVLASRLLFSAFMAYKEKIEKMSSK